KEVPIFEGSSVTTTERYKETYNNVSQDIRDQLNAAAEAVQIILTGIDNDIYSTVDACPNACEMWKAIERLYKTMNELVRNECDVTNHQVNVQFLLQLQPEWQRSQQAATRNRGKAIVNSPPPIYDQEPTMVAEDDDIVNQDNSPRINRGTGYDNQRIVNVAGARETVTLDAADNSGPIFDSEPLQKDDDLANERDLLASLIEKLKCEIDDSKNRNKFLETSNKALVNKLTGEIEDFKTKNKSLESSNNHFKEAKNEMLKTNQLIYKDLKKFQAELDRYHDVKYASKVEIDCAKAKGDLIESLESYYSRFYKMMNELVRNQCDVTNHQVNVQFLVQLQPEWQRSQHAATRNEGKAIVNSPPPIYDQEPSMVAEDNEMSKDNEIDKLMALISLSFKKIYKPTNNNH
nr:hypothetical protein [Tanacetum cinerariifolium]